MNRITKDEYYLDFAKTACQRSTCLRRRYGAVIVKNDEVIGTGYNGAPRGERNCIDCGFCLRDDLNIPKGERYEICRAVHAEMNALLSVARRDAVGATIYIYGEEQDGTPANPAPCLLCRRQIVNAGIICCKGLVNGEIREIDISESTEQKQIDLIIRNIKTNKS